MVPPPLKAPSPRTKLSTLRDVLAFNVRTARVARGMSQEKLGFAAELDRTYVSHVERGQVNCSVDNVEKLALALAVDASVLFMQPAASARARP